MSAVKMGLTIEEAAECTGIGRNTMRKLVDWGKLPVLKVGRKAIIHNDTLALIYAESYITRRLHRFNQILLFQGSLYCTVHTHSG